MGLALAAVLLGPVASGAATKVVRPKTPVMVGGEEDLDACGTLSQVTGLSSGASGFLSVRTSPSAKSAELDRLRNGATVTDCDDRSGFAGIVYGKDCRVSSPIAKRQAYSGPCRSGWVSRRYLTVVAG